MIDKVSSTKICDMPDKSSQKAAKKSKKHDMDGEGFDLLTNILDTHV